MKFEVQGIIAGPALEQFRTDWVGITAEENGIILGDGRISQAQLLVINLFCGHDEAYDKADELTINTLGPAQAEMEALFRARGRALAILFQGEMKSGS